MDEQNWPIFIELLDKDFVSHWPGGFDVLGPEGVKKAVTPFYIAFPDIKHIFEDFIAEGDKVVVRLAARGTHKGEFMGIAPTGKQVIFTEIVIYHIANCKIMEAWVEYDALGMFQQLGAVPLLGED